MSPNIFYYKKLLKGIKFKQRLEQRYCISRSDRSVLQRSPALWIHAFNSRASKYFNYICENFFLYILLILLFFISGYHFDKTISDDINGLQIFEDWNHCGNNPSYRNCDWQYSEGTHPAWIYYVDGIHRKTSSNWYGHLRQVMILDFVIELVKIHDVDNVKLSLSEKCLYMKPYLLFMLELEQCVEHIYFDLYQYTYKK